MPSLTPFARTPGYAGRKANRQGLITQRMRFAVGGGVIGKHLPCLLTIDLELLG